MLVLLYKLLTLPWEESEVESKDLKCCRGKYQISTKLKCVIVIVNYFCTCMNK